MNIGSRLAKFSFILLMLSLLIAAKCSAPQFKNEVRRVWSVQFRECRCQNYDLNNTRELDSLIPCEKFFNNDNLPNYMYCDDLVGFNAEAWALRITPKMKEVHRWVQDSCTK